MTVAARPAPTWTALVGFRGLVVAAVLGYHALRMALTRHGGNWGEVSPLWWWAGTARFGVDAFFVLSGFLVVASWQRCRRHAATAGAAVREFAARRAWRILPAYWASLTVFGTIALARAKIDWGDVGLLVGVQQYVEGHLPAQVNLPYWSLTTEVHFYLLVPAVAWLFHRVGGWPLVGAAAVLSIWWVQAPVRGELSASLIVGRLDQFLVGVVAADLVRRASTGPRPRLVRLATRPGAGWVMLGALVTLGTYHGATFQRGIDNLLVWAIHPLAGLVLGGLVVRVLCGPPVVVCERPAWRFLGVISYSLYLWHYPVLYMGFDRLGLRGAEANQSSLAVLAATLALMALAVAVAGAAYLAVERPAARRKRGRRRSSDGVGTRPARVVGGPSDGWVDRRHDGIEIDRRLPRVVGAGGVQEELDVAVGTPQGRGHGPHHGGAVRT